MRRKWLTLMMAIMVLLLSVVSLTACDWQSGGGGSSDGSSNGDDEETVKVTNPVEWFEDFDVSNYSFAYHYITETEEEITMTVYVDGNNLHMEYGYGEEIVEMIEDGANIYLRYNDNDKWHRTFISVNDDSLSTKVLLATFKSYMDKKAILDGLYLSDIDTMNKYYNKNEDGSWVLKPVVDGMTMEITIFNDEELTCTFSAEQDSGFVEGVFWEVIAGKGTCTFRKGNGNVSVILPDKEDIVE